MNNIQNIFISPESFLHFLVVIATCHYSLVLPLAWKQNHTLCILLYLASFTQHNVSEIQLYHINNYFLFIIKQNPVVWIYVFVTFYRDCVLGFYIRVSLWFSLEQNVIQKKYKNQCSRESSQTPCPIPMLGETFCYESATK